MIVTHHKRTTALRLRPPSITDSLRLDDKYDSFAHKDAIEYDDWLEWKSDPRPSCKVDQCRRLERLRELDKVKFIDGRQLSAELSNKKTLCWWGWEIDHARYDLHEFEKDFIFYQRSRHCPRNGRVRIQQDARYLSIRQRGAECSPWPELVFITVDMRIKIPIRN